MSLPLSSATLRGVGLLDALIGESAASLAAFCLSQHKTPAAVLDDPESLSAFQRQLLRQGVPLYWYEDLPAEHPAWAAAQFLAVTGLWPGGDDHLRFAPDEPMEAGDIQQRLRAAGLDQDLAGSDPLSRTELARRITEVRFGMT